MIYDIIIIGGGPAGLTAAIYARRANKSVLVIEKNVFGGQITSSPKVENIPGFASISGSEFGEKLLEQAVNLGANIEYAEVISIKNYEKVVKTIITDTDEFSAKAIIIACGTKHRMLGLKNEEEFIGNGVAFCAVCDGAFYEGKDVAVIGGGNSALQEAIQLSELCSKVYIVQNLDHLTGEKRLQEEIATIGNIEVILNGTVQELKGMPWITGLTGITIGKDNSEIDLAVKGIFIAIGLIPQNEIFKEFIQLTDHGYIEVDKDCKTSLPGIFSAGDCINKKIRQVTTAAADGSIAALSACTYLDSLEV